MKLFTTVCWIAIAFVPFGCGGGSRPSGYVLADYSLDSTPESHAEAIRVVGIVSKQIATHRGQIAADTFQGSSLSHLRWRVSHVFSPSDGLPNSDYYRQLDVARQVRAIEQQTKELFQGQRNEQRTDVIGSLLAFAERRRADGASEPCLLLISNMKSVEPSDGLLFTKQRLNTTFVNQSIARLKRNNKIADLEGVRLYVIGAGVDPHNPMTTDDQLGLRSFWRKYFDLAGAELVAWEPTLSVRPTCE